MDSMTVNEHAKFIIVVLVMSEKYDFNVIGADRPLFNLKCDKLHNLGTNSTKAVVIRYNLHRKKGRLKTVFSWFKWIDLAMNTKESTQPFIAAYHKYGTSMQSERFVCVHFQGRSSSIPETFQPTR